MRKLSSEEKLSTHQYQFDGTHRNRNECALCSMSMVLRLAAKQTDVKNFRLEAVELGRFLDRMPFRYPRFPAWLPGPGGATHPFAAYWGLKEYLRGIKRAHRNMQWSVVMKRRAQLEDLAAMVSAQNPVLIYGVGETGIPHVVVPIERTRGKWQILDPGYPRKSNPRAWTDEQLLKWWVNYSFIYPHGILIALEPTVGGATTPKSKTSR